VNDAQMGMYGIRGVVMINGLWVSLKALVLWQQCFLPFVSVKGSVQCSPSNAL